MKIRPILVLYLILLLSYSIHSQSMIINEIYNSSGGDEWIELLVLQDGLDIRNWSVRDFSSSGSAQNPLIFSNNDTWGELKKGTILIIARSENSFSEDLDPSDYSMIVKSNNALYFSGNVFSIAGGSDAIQIRDNSQNHIFGVSWGSSNSSSLPSPKVHFTGSSSSNTSTFFNEDDVSKLSSVSSWTQNGTSSLGVGNSPNNINWIQSLRLKSEGSGSVSMNPTIASGDSLITIKFDYVRDARYTVNVFKIIIPEEFTWTKSLSQVNISNFTSSPEIFEDTVVFNDVQFLSDSVEIQITEIHTPIFTGDYRFGFLSGTDLALDDVNPIPVMTVFGAAIPIADAKINDENGIAVRLGEFVTVRGIVTVSSQFGSPSYIQDNSAGISIFGSSFSDAVEIGDEVIVSGTISQFNGLNQLESPILHSIVSSGNNVEPLLSSPAELKNDGFEGIENYEGRLVRLNGVEVKETNGNPVSSWAYQNYLLLGDNPNDSLEIRIDNNTPLIGLPAPAGRFDVVGVLGQYKTSLPFIGGYQLMPRLSADIISNGPIIETFPVETELTSNSITLEWRTINPGTSRIRYGKTSNYELGVIEPDNDLSTTHNVKVDGLSPSTIYNLQVFSVANSDTSFSGNIISSTASASPTTGVINVYFNHSINSNVATGPIANGNVNFKSVVINRIGEAKHSIDASLYSLSGSVGAELANALVNAKNRGVQVRVIGEYDNRTTAPWATLQSNSIPYINDQFGNNDGSGLCHNKFFVIDYKGGAGDSVWVITGSWNPTDPGTNDDRQNLIEIQDVALAGAYTVEFEEMWGSNTNIPNAANSRFGSRKLNNTPHKFVIGGVNVECYFSPSDRTTAQIGRILGNAQISINAATLTFTRRDLADSIISSRNKGAKARVILSNNVDSGTQFPYLQSNGIDIRLKGFTTGLLHHKYAVVDAELVSANPITITGSHNWSSSAENSNDENTLIIKDAQIANYYLQEFAARYYEAGGTDSIVVTDIAENPNPPAEYYLSQNYPNPFNPVTRINFSIPARSKVSLNVYNLLGEKVAILIDEVKEAGNYHAKFDGSRLPSGVYFYQISAGDYKASKKLILLK